MAAGLTEVVPFLLTTRRRRLGARFAAGPYFRLFAVADGRLVAGQNLTSSERVAQFVMEALRHQSRVGLALE